ncbi:hypothetical protein BCR34DRAFT_497646, partial [Clohesyomyces aquaticus]
VLFYLLNKLLIAIRYINNVLINYLDDFYITYLDNILIYSKDKATYTLHVKKVLERLR